MVNGADNIPPKGEFTLIGYQVGNETLKPEESTANFYRQQDVFTLAKETTLNTPYIDDVYAYVEDNNASTRDKQGFDIAARPYNISGFKVMKDSDMFKIFTQINGDDFSEGINDHGERVILFDQNKSDGKIKMFSTEQDNEGKIYYAIKDADGKTYKFTEDGKFL